LLKIQGPHGRAKHFSVQFVDPDHGSALGVWTRMGSPATPTKQQIAELRKASELELPNELAANTPIEIPAQRLVLIILPK
jgi:xylan 1,4-beta-xylosidase